MTDDQIDEEVQRRLKLLDAARLSQQAAGFRTQAAQLIKQAVKLEEEVRVLRGN